MLIFDLDMSIDVGNEQNGRTRAGTTRDLVDARRYALEGATDAREQRPPVARGGRQNQLRWGLQKQRLAPSSF